MKVTFFSLAILINLLQRHAHSSLITTSHDATPLLMCTVQFFLCANKKMEKELITETNSNSTFKKMKWLPCKQEKKGGGGGGTEYILTVCQIRAKLSSFN